MKPGLEQFMIEKGYETIYHFKGKALPNVTDWKHLNLKHKIVTSIDTDKCIGCDLCYIACDDGARQAFRIPEGDGNRIPEIIEENWVGCNLCSLVCPVEECITMEQRDDGKEHLSWDDKSKAGGIPTSFDDDRAGGKHHFVPTVADALKHRK